MIEYTYNIFASIDKLNIDRNSEEYQRLNLFVSKLSLRTQTFLRHKPVDDISIYYNYKQIAHLLGGRKWQERMQLLIDAGIIEKIWIQNQNNRHQALHTFYAVTERPQNWHQPITFKRIINSLNCFYDAKAVGFSPLVRNVILPNLRRLTFDCSIEEFNQYSNDLYLWNDLKFFTGLKGLQLYDFVIEDSFSGRIHTIITRLPSELRQFIRINGEKCVELDLHQCQVMMLDKILYDINPANSFGNWFMQINDIYEQYQLEFNFDSREEGKIEFCKTIYGTIKSKTAKQFANRFPDAGSIIKSYKQSNYKNFAKQLQMAEVVFFSKVWNQLKKERIAFLSIHDALIVPVSKINRTYDILLHHLRLAKFRKFNIHTRNL